MQFYKNLFSLIAIFFSITAIGQSENIFHDRSYWRGNPSLEEVKQKISEGNDPVILDANGYDATTLAILQKSNEEVIQYLLSLEGNGIDKKTHDSRTYLHWSAYTNQTEIVKYLLDKGYSTKLLDSHGSTPVVYAANAGVTDQVLYNTFEKYGVNLVNEKNENGANILLLVAPYLLKDNELKFFIEKGLKLQSTDKDGNNIFNYAVKKGNVDFLNLLISKGVNPKALNNQGANAFLFAAQGARGYSNPLAVYQYLKELGLKPNMVTKTGESPLHYLASNNTNVSIFNFFLNAGADVNIKDSNGNTPFINAASRNNLEIVQLLSLKVTDLNTTNNNGQNAIMLATQRNSAEVVNFLIQKIEASTTPLTTVLEVKDNDGNSLAYYLLASFDSKKPDVFETKIKLLQNKGLPINTTQAENNTLLHLAAQNNNLELLKLVSTYGIDVNAKNDAGMTALHIAAMKATDDQIIKFLIDKGADIKAQTEFGEVALDLVMENELLKEKNLTFNYLK